MSVGLIVIILIVIFIVIVFKKMSEVARLNEEWMRTAGNLKMTFKKAQGMLDIPQLAGEKDGFPVSVFVNYEKRSNAIVPFTVYVVRLPVDRSVESLLDKAAARVERVRTGHPVVDKLLSAGGFDKAKVRSLMQDAKEEAIAKFAKAYPNISVDDNRIVCKFEGVDGSADMIQARIAGLLRLAKTLAWRGEGEEAKDSAAKSVFAFEEEAPAQDFSSLPLAPAPEAPARPEKPSIPSFEPLNEARVKMDSRPVSDVRAATSPRAAAEVRETSNSKTVLDSRQATESKQVLGPRAAAEVRETSNSKTVSDSRQATESKQVLGPRAAAEVRETTNSKTVLDSRLATESKQVLGSRAATESKPLSQNASVGAAAPEDFAGNPEALAKVLFSSPLPGQAEKAAFEKIKGSSVQWSGVLKSAQEYGMDFNFSGGAGTKAVFELCEVSPGKSSLKVKIKAVVQLPKEAAQALRGKNGQALRFSGSLHKFEPFAKELFLANGSVEL
jgi:hypothetical protein